MGTATAAVRPPRSESTDVPLPVAAVGSMCPATPTTTCLDYYPRPPTCRKARTHPIQSNPRRHASGKHTKHVATTTIASLGRSACSCCVVVGGDLALDRPVLFSTSAKEGRVSLSTPSFPPPPPTRCRWRKPLDSLTLATTKKQGEKKAESTPALLLRLKDNERIPQSSIANDTPRKSSLYVKVCQLRVINQNREIGYQYIETEQRKPLVNPNLI